MHHHWSGFASTPPKSAEELKAEKEELAKAKAKAVERSSIVAPQLNLAQMEAAIAKGGSLGYDQEMINDLMAQTYAASVRWPKDSVLHVRLQHIVTCLETKEWPVPANFLMSEVAADSGPATPEPAQEGPNVRTNNPRRIPRRSREGPVWPEEGPRWASDGPKRSRLPESFSL